MPANTNNTEVCALCGRVRSLTFHHLIPRKLHRRTYYRKHVSKARLHAGIRLCRECHRGLHRFYDEVTLAKCFDSLEKLQADSTIRRHVAWVAKQK